MNKYLEVYTYENKMVFAPRISLRTLSPDSANRLCASAVSSQKVPTSGMAGVSDYCNIYYGNLVDQVYESGDSICCAGAVALGDLEVVGRACIYFAEVASMLSFVVVFVLCWDDMLCKGIVALLGQCALQRDRGTSSG